MHRRFLLVMGILFIAAPALAQPSCSSPTRTTLASAHWIDTNELELYLPNQIQFQSSLKFWLVDCEPMGSDHQWPLSLLTTSRWPLHLGLDKLPWPLAEMITRPLQIWVEDNGQIVFQTSIQWLKILERDFTDDKTPLGPRWNNGAPSVAVWAPTAQNVELLLYKSLEDPSPQAWPLTKKGSTWWMSGLPEWKNAPYRFRVTVYAPWLGRTEHFEVIDPYATALSINSQFSLFLDLNTEELKPPGWGEQRIPRLASTRDAVIYESHLRDLTAMDEGLPANLRGTYLGLVDPRSRARHHLEILAQNGITHLHLLPLSDFATVNEDRSQWVNLPIVPVSPDSPAPQEKISKIRLLDGYNWGYDPIHYFVPEGSYSTQANGGTRLYEFRKMVMELHRLGLRLVMDVVYNHTFASDLDDLSNLDRLVPLYYHRRDIWGLVYKSSCCPDLATENKMVERMIIDSLTHWVQDFHVTGFRFDLMNLLPTSSVEKIKQSLHHTSRANSFLRGNDILIYGEAWPFGSLEETQPGMAFTQLRSYGKGIGVFNDRLRDALRGGTANTLEKSDQGFATGLFFDFNKEPANRNTPVDLSGQRDKLLHLGDVVKIGLTGNLRDYLLRDHLGNPVRAQDILFRGIPTAYARDPGETISYASAHDGYTLWDAIQAKLPFETSGREPRSATIEERVQTQWLMLSAVALGQGIPFFEGGSEILRSKSGDQDSYDSGDWFNFLDLTFSNNRWGQGLPVAWRNQDDWSFWRPRLQHPELQIQSRYIQQSFDYFLSLLRIRRSSPLFRLSSLQEVTSSLRFLVDDNTHAEIPGVIAMELSDEELNVDPERKRLVIFWNSGSQEQNFYSQRLAQRDLKPHRQSVDFFKWYSTDNLPMAGKFHLPPRSTLVFEERK